VPTFRIPLVGSVTNRNNDPSVFASKDQLFANCYPEITSNPVSEKTSVELYKRPGYSKGGALAGVDASDTVGAIVSWTGNTNSTPPVVAAFVNTGGTSTSIWDLVTDAKKGGDIANTTQCTALTETSVGSTAYLVGNFIDSGTGAVEQWVYDEGGSWAQVTDSDFPASTLVGFPAHMDGYVFNMTSTGRIHNSDLNSVTAYTANNYITANAFPDKGVTVARMGRFIVGYGEKSIQFFENRGNPSGSPLAAVGTIALGAARRTASGLQTVLQANGTVYWIGTNSEGAAIGVYRFSGQDPEKVSSPAIDKLLAQGGIAGFVGTLYSHGMVHIVLRGTSGTWCFCAQTKTWWKLVLSSGEINACLGVGISSGAVTRTYLTTSANARANSLGSSTLQDDGSDYTLTVQTERLDLGTDKRKFWRKLRVIADTQSSASNLGVAWSDDDFANYTTARNIDMSTTQNWITALGSSRRRSWKFTNTANTPCRIQAIEIDYDIAAT
jgi:hypothetical protein